MKADQTDDNWQEGKEVTDGRGLIVADDMTRKGNGRFSIAKVFVVCERQS